MSREWLSQHVNDIDEYAGGYLTKAGRPVMAGAAFAYVGVLAVATAVGALAAYIWRVVTRRPRA